MAQSLLVLVAFLVLRSAILIVKQGPRDCALVLLYECFVQIGNDVV